MHLSELIDTKVLGGTPDGIPGGTHDGIRVGGVHCDSRKIQPGDVFVAIQGTHEDGAKYIPDAIKAGAVAIITDRPVKKQPVPVINVPDSRVALAHMAARLYPHKPNLIAAVTGTNGKTSTADFLRQIWTRIGWKASSIGTLGVRGGSPEILASLTTPDSLSLHRMLASLAQDHINHVVMEASSHGINQHRLDGLYIAVAGFTNLSRDHLDYHGNVEHYFQSKRRLFTELLAKSGAAVINIDCKTGKKLAQEIKGQALRLVTVGKAKNAHFQITNIESHHWGQVVSIKHDGRDYQLPLALFGTFQVENAVLAAAMAYGSGVEARYALLTLPYLKPAPGRMHSIPIPNSTAKIIVDYAHTPDALDRALHSLRDITEGRIGVVFGCGGDRDKGKRGDMGQIAETAADFVIITDDNPRHEDPALIRAEIQASCPKAEEIGDRAKAIARGISRLEDGDILLIAGKGHEHQQLIGDETLPFSDEGMVRAILNTIPAGAGR